MTAPVLLEVTRGGRVESRHRGVLLFLDPDGSISLSHGDIAAPVYARSSLKPLQASAMLRSGWTPGTEALALAAASHNGEALHRDGVRRTLTAAGLDESALQCPAALPSGEAALIAYLGGGGHPAPLCHNCSGKHAAMTATCVAAGWDVGAYLDPAHPLQSAIRSEIERLCATTIAYSSVDGCGAPAHALPLPALAAGFARLAAAPPGTTEGSVADAMRTHPQLVGGTGRAVSELMAAVPGLVAKDGAEGVWAAALPDGRAFAAKVDDGAPRALGPLVAAALAHWGVEADVVGRHATVPVTGGGRTVGEVRWSSDLVAALNLA